MRRTLVIFVAVLWGQLLVAAPGAADELRTPVVVDTDMGLDDARAIILLLSSPHVAVAGFVTSDGSAAPEPGARNLKRLLAALGQAELPVGVGRQLDRPSPPWREMSDTLGWADLPAAAPADPDTMRAAVPLLRELLARSPVPVTYVCLGPLTNLADLLRADPSARQRITTIVYAGLPPGAPEPSWNSTRDPAAAEAALQAGIRFDALQPPPDRVLIFDLALYQQIATIDTPPARLITRLHPHAKVQELLRANHFRAWDETVALYLDDPALGTLQPVDSRPTLFHLAAWDPAAARAEYLELVSNPASHPLGGRAPVVLQRFPTDPALFQADVQPLVEQTVAAYGLEEWETTVLTNELHRHLGIYSILGAKMGLRARELLSASLDELAVESAAGLTPPVSCLNDGLQTATGASLGRGTIKVSTAPPARAEAVFIKGTQRLRLRVKPAVQDRIRADVQRAVQQYGDRSPEYFREVRRLSLRYWAEMNRAEIFDVNSD